MATKTAILAVKIVSDAKDFTKGIDDSVSKLDKLQNKMSKLTMPATAIVGGLAVIGKGFLDAASDAEQAQGGVEAVFGKWSKDVDKFASNSAKRLGLSGTSYDKLAAQIGTSLKSAGVPMDELAGKTDKLQTAGADLAAVFGGSTTQVVEAFGSAFRGEYDSLEQFGIVLNDSTVMAGLAEKGLDKLEGKALTSAKQQEVYNQIMEQSAPFTGKFADEANTAAGAQERLNAQFEDAQAQLGEKLLPYMVGLVEELVKFVDWISANTELVMTLAVIIGAVAGAVLILNGALLLMNILAAVNPFVIITVAVLALIGIIVYLATQTTFFQDVWAAVCLFVGDRINELVGWFNDLGKNAQRVADDTRNWFVNAGTAIANWFRDRINEVVGFFSNLGSNAQTKANEVRNWFVNAFNGMRDTASNIINAIVGFFDRIGGAVRNAMGWVRNLFNMGGMPGWLSSILGRGGTGFDITGDFGFGVAPEGFGIGATGGLSSGSMFSGNSSPAIEQTTVNITVNGALDPMAVGEQINSHLQRYLKNTGQQVAVRIN